MTRVRSARAAAAVTPGCRRPMQFSQYGGRLSGGRSWRIGKSSPSIIGTRKPGGMTPTSVCGLPSMTRVLPSAAGSPPSRRRQNPSLTMTVRGTPSRSPPLREAAAERRRDPERGEEIGCHRRAGQTLRLAAEFHPEADRRRAVRRYRGERTRSVAHRQEVGHGQRRTIEGLVWAGEDDADEPLRCRIRQRSEQHAIDEAEDRARCADAERERDDRDQADRLRPQHYANGETQILDQAHAATAEQG